MKATRICTAVLALVLSAAAPAAERLFTASGFQDPTAPITNDASYIEIWGFGATAPPYVNPATFVGDPYAGLISSSVAASQAALGGLFALQASFAWDTAAAPIVVSPSGLTNTYAVAPMTVTLSGGGQAPVSLQSGVSTLRVGVNATGRQQTIRLGTAGSTVEGAIPGNSFVYTAPAQPSATVDLVDLVNTGSTAVPFVGLDAFAALPIRLTAPTEFRLVYLQVLMQRNSTTTTFANTPPATLDIADFNLVHSLFAAFDGVYGVSVNAADYGDGAAFAAAQTWVQANLRQINFEVPVYYDLFSVSSVPEAPSAGLMLAGLLLLGASARRRRAA